MESARKVRAILMICLGLLMFGFTGASQGGLFAEGVHQHGTHSKYVNDANGYTIEIPDDWKQMGGGPIEEGIELDVIALSPLADEKDQFRDNMNIVVGELDEELDLDEWFEQNSKELGEVVDHGNTKISGVDSKWVIFKGEIDDIPLLQKQYYFVHDGKFYVITFTATSDDYQRFEKTFDDIAFSLKLNK